jgi:hypothetical protein
MVCAFPTRYRDIEPIRLSHGTAIDRHTVYRWIQANAISLKKRIRAPTARQRTGDQRRIPMDRAPPCQQWHRLPDAGRVSAVTYFSWDSDPWAKQTSLGSVYRCGGLTEAGPAALTP